MNEIPNPYTFATAEAIKPSGFVGNISYSTREDRRDQVDFLTLKQERIMSLTIDPERNIQILHLSKELESIYKESIGLSPDEIIEYPFNLTLPPYYQIQT
ncbi:hypothetical protein A2Z22_01615 [Candidatus Woesebacteria bacterium RBG_16_34_12]|uniref:Uncharacterized protein n=1 Tax=Candidatus Woesebacteria bacterium RBG_16_34_12 TaxID=1802480 RepID=A0A1F7XA79_9BACT|nr:MAG: hypothetical protein A2Z22_01615 [Candidatus Woesebacteria bacterium RBG_16_34_12]